ncbi:MAG TPA: cytochrome P460 family protein [Saprospiraceae bacterium]|nr:cytochrome P460 family protein [Saprospiraceae bacterium]
MKKYILIFSSLLLTFALFHSCKKDDNTQTDDQKLLAEATAGLTVWPRTTSVTDPAGNSIHGPFQIWMNATALAALDGSGNLPVGASFPTGSLIVKSIHDTKTGPVTSYVVMKKDPSNANAGSGWVWADYKIGGEVNHSISEKGGLGGCVSCHGGSTNRDLVRSFDLH